MTHDYSQTIEAHLTGEDDMAHRFLTRAADAIVARSSLSQQLAALTATLDDITLARDTLDDIKRAQDGRIADLERQCAEAHSTNIRVAAELVEAEATIRARQHDIDLLDTTVAELRHCLDTTSNRLDYYTERENLLNASLHLHVDKLNAINAILGKPAVDPDPFHEIDTHMITWIDNRTDAMVAFETPRIADPTPEPEPASIAEYHNGSTIDTQAERDDPRDYERDSAGEDYLDPDRHEQTSSLYPMSYADH